MPNIEVKDRQIGAHRRIKNQVDIVYRALISVFVEGKTNAVQ
jgi:hypothetical protein